MAMKLVLFVALAVLAVEARPKYIAIPLQDLRLVRHARSAYPQRPQYRSQPRPVYMQVPDGSEKMPVYAEPAEEFLVADGSDRYERQSSDYGHGHEQDHVDYGAYTGGYGAFGWYSDHPVCINCGYH